MVDEKSDSCQDLQKRRLVRFTCTMDIFAKISYGRHDKYLRAGGSGYLSIPGPERQKAKIVDLSQGGAKVMVKSPINTGTSVAIRIESSLKIPAIEGRARIVWLKSVKTESAAYLMGVAFHGFGWRERFRLRRFVRQLRKSPKTS